MTSSARDPQRQSPFSRRARIETGGVGSAWAAEGSPFSRRARIETALREEELELVVVALLTKGED